MKKIMIMLISLLTSAAYAQEGINFETATWKETLAKAKKENKLIFVDIYTTWCGPCKMMAKDVFPLKAVSEKFNSSFINFKTDAEKGEGIEIAKTYKVNAYPTYLFVNGDGVLYYTTLGAMPEDQFLKEAGNALVEFSDPKPLAMWEAEYAQKKTDKEFLLKYLQKRQKLALKSDFIVDQYVSVSTRGELLNKDVLNLLLTQRSASIDGAYFKFVKENSAEIEKILARPQGFGNQMVGVYAVSDLNRAIEKKDPQLLERIVAIRSAIPSELPADWEADELRVRFFGRTENEKELIKVLMRYGKSMMAYDKEKIKAGNAAQLANFEKAVSAGQLKGTPEEIEQARKFYSTIESTNYAYRIRGLAESALKRVNDKGTLSQALNWLQSAGKYSENFSIAEVRAGVLQKLGKKEEALASQRQAITSFEAMKMENEALKSRLQGNLKKIMENKPTWVTEPANTVVAAK